MRTRGYLITAEGRGVFLGLIHVQGGVAGMWSRDYRVGFVPSYAAVFVSAEQAHRFADMFDPPPEGLELVDVLADIDDEENGMVWASRDACKAAGIATWITPDTDTFNTLPT